MATNVQHSSGNARFAPRIALSRRCRSEEEHRSHDANGTSQPLRNKVFHFVPRNCCEGYMEAKFFALLRAAVFMPKSVLTSYWLSCFWS